MLPGSEGTNRWTVVRAPLFSGDLDLLLPEPAHEVPRAAELWELLKDKLQRPLHPQVGLFLKASVSGLAVAHSYHAIKFPALGLLPDRRMRTRAKQPDLKFAQRALQA